MQIGKIIYEEDSIKVTIPEPVLLHNDAGVPHNRMTVYIDWSPEIVYTDEFTQRASDAEIVVSENTWPDKLKHMVIGKAVQALVKKFDEGLVQSE